MRTTIRLEEDVATLVREEMRRTGATFKAVVNDAIRKGLTPGSAPADRATRFLVKPKACGFRPGVDIMKLNQLLD
ncbi:MAG: CopG family transcriptional regulator [Thermoanaerobaculia bacterium]|jgi:hypothetical protein